METPSIPSAQGGDHTLGVIWPGGERETIHAFLRRLRHEDGLSSSLNAIRLRDEVVFQHTLESAAAEAELAEKARSKGSSHAPDADKLLKGFDPEGDAMRHASRKSQGKLKRQAQRRRRKVLDNERDEKAREHAMIESLEQLTLTPDHPKEGEPEDTGGISGGEASSAGHSIQTFSGYTIDDEDVSQQATGMTSGPTTGDAEYLACEYVGRKRLFRQVPGELSWYTQSQVWLDFDIEIRMRFYQSSEWFNATSRPLQLDAQFGDRAAYTLIEHAVDPFLPQEYGSLLDDVFLLTGDISTSVEDYENHSATTTWYPLQSRYIPKQLTWHASTTRSVPAQGRHSAEAKLLQSHFGLTADEEAPCDVRVRVTWRMLELDEESE